MGGMIPSGCRGIAGGWEGRRRTAAGCIGLVDDRRRRRREVGRRVEIWAYGDEGKQTCHFQRICGYILMDR
jgi:hypothetical protein